MINISISADISAFEVSATLISSVLGRTSESVFIRCWCRGLFPESFEVNNLRVEFRTVIDSVHGRYPWNSGPSAYDRLLVIRDCPDWDRCLIMDYDQVALCDLGPLFDLDMRDCLLAAKMHGQGVDLSYAMREWIKRPIPNGWEHAAGNPYFSMGPLLNLAEMRKAGTWEKLMEAQGAFLADENLALVAATEGRTMDFDPKWNLFAPHEVADVQVPDGVVHWLGWPKPWHEGANVWRPELWESERCSWEQLRMGLWEKPVAVEVESDDDHGVEELLKRGWKVRLLTGEKCSSQSELPAFRYPDLEVMTADGCGTVPWQEDAAGSPDEGNGAGIERSGVPEGSPRLLKRLERVRFGSWMKASEWLGKSDLLPAHVILRGPVPREEVERVVAMGYGESCMIRYGEWPAGGPMPRALEFSSQNELRRIEASEECYLRRGATTGEGIPRAETRRVDENASRPAERMFIVPEPGRKVAVVVAALGRGRRHLWFLLESLRRNFLPGVEKRFFVFTDGERISGEDVTSIQVAGTEPRSVHSERCRWLLESEKELADYDFVFLMKPQVRVMEPVGAEEVLSGRMVACLHSSYEGELLSKIRFEENKASVTWIAPGEGRHYFCGSWQGGERRSFLAAVRHIVEWMEQDRVAGVKPLWGDESYWNRYWADLPPDRMLGSEYAWRIGTKAPRRSPPKVLVQALNESKSDATKPARPARRIATR